MPNTKISALTAGDPALSTDALPIARGGANFQVTASSVAGLINRAASITASGTPVVLTVSSAPQSFVSGSGGQVIQLPNATTLTVGTIFRFDNNQSSGAITVNNNSSTLIVSVPSGSFVVVTLLSNGTAAGTWDRHDLAPANVSWSTNTFDYPGSITSATWNGVAVAINRGGTGQATASAAFNALSPVTSTGDLIIGNGANSSTRLAIGSNGYVLTSNGSTASWQAAAGGGVTSFSAGSTGFSPSSSTTGAVTLSGTLGVGSGGTGASSMPSNGQLLIGNGSTYSVANLTAGAGVTITNGSGSITIAASGGGGPTINVLNVTTTSSGTFYNNSPSSTYSKPLIGNATGGTNYGAFFFKNGSTGYNVSSASLSSIGITDSTSSFTSYTSGSDFSSSPGTFNVSDDIVACYGLMIYSAGMQTLFADSKTAQTTPNLAPFDATSGYASSNPGIFVSTTTGTYNNSGGRLGAVVSKSMTNYILGFGSADFSSASPTVTSIQFTINSSSATYYVGTDFTVSFATNSSNGGFEMLISVSNGTLTTLLNNSFL